MSYKLINKTTKEESICSKVVVDGFDYYVSKDVAKEFDYSITATNKIKQVDFNRITLWVDGCPKVIATNNPSIDLPKVIDEVDLLCKDFATREINDGCESYHDLHYGFVNGYNKSKETHPNTDEDMIEFYNWITVNITQLNYSEIKLTKELLQIWKSQQLKILYYENNNLR